jgi:hypothetical protein
MREILTQIPGAGISEPLSGEATRGPERNTCKYYRAMALAPADTGLRILRRENMIGKGLDDA